MLLAGGGAASAALVLMEGRGVGRNMQNADSAGFQMPEQSEPHARTFMQWPVGQKVHPDPVFLVMLQGAIATVALLNSSQTSS